MVDSLIKLKQKVWHSAALIVCVVASVLICAVGCGERKMAPALKYSANEVQQLREKIDNFEW